MLLLHNGWYQEHVWDREDFLRSLLIRQVVIQVNGKLKKAKLGKMVNGLPFRNVFGYQAKNHK